MLIILLNYNMDKIFIIQILLIILMLIICYKNYKKHNENYENNSELSTRYINEIPTNVFLIFLQTVDLPNNMNQTLINNINNNPEFNFYVYDDKMCKEFIQNNFDSSILEVYNGLKPGAYKADLFRYCILYVHGGVYMDVKFKLHIKLKDLIEKYNEVFVKDPDWYPDSCKRGCTNGFIIAKKKNSLFLDCIHQIKKNYNSKYYGNNFLYPTGPCLLGYIIRSKYNHIEYNLELSRENKNSPFDIVDKDNNIIISSYENYRDELAKFPNATHYTQLWYNKDIYN
jgi:mannosyltransferase OCH1-like enzyme